jgi:hypothetical protein
MIGIRSNRIKNLVLALSVSACISSGQVGQTNVAVSTPAPISVKLEAPAPPVWPQYVLSPAVAAAAALLGVYFTARSNRRANAEQRQHDIRKGRADKQLEVLSRIGQILVQTNHALKDTDWRLKRARKLREAQASAAEISDADEDSRRARQELYQRLDELGTAAGGAGFALSDPLWRQLQSLHQSFADASQKERSTAPSRAEQLDSLDKQMDEFLALARNELDALSGRV